MTTTLTNIVILNLTNSPIPLFLLPLVVVVEVLGVLEVLPVGAVLGFLKRGVTFFCSENFR